MASEAKEETAVLDFERKYTEAKLLADGWWKRADMTRERYQKAEKLLNELRSKVPDDRPLQEKLAQCEQAMQDWDRYAKAIAAPRPLHQEIADLQTRAESAESRLTVLAEENEGLKKRVEELEAKAAQFETKEALFADWTPGDDRPTITVCGDKAMFEQFSARWGRIQAQANIIDDLRAQLSAAVQRAEEAERKLKDIETNTSVKLGEFAKLVEVIDAECKRLGVEWRGTASTTLKAVVEAAGLKPGDVVFRPTGEVRKCFSKGEYGKHGEDFVYWPSNEKSVHEYRIYRRIEAPADAASGETGDIWTDVYRQQDHSGEVNKMVDEDRRILEHQIEVLSTTHAKRKWKRLYSKLIATASEVFGISGLAAADQVLDAMAVKFKESQFRLDLAELEQHALPEDASGTESAAPAPPVEEGERVFVVRDRSTGSAVLYADGSGDEYAVASCYGFSICGNVIGPEIVAQRIAAYLDDSSPEHARIRELEQEVERLKTEKETRIKYQGIVYDACNSVDLLLGNRPGSGVAAEDLATAIRRSLTKRCEDEIRMVIPWAVVTVSMGDDTIPAFKLRDRFAERGMLQSAADWLNRRSEIEAQLAAYKRDAELIQFIKKQHVSMSCRHLADRTTPEWVAFSELNPDTWSTGDAWRSTPAEALDHLAATLSASQDGKEGA